MHLVDEPISSEKVIDAIRKLRNLKAENGLAQNTKPKIGADIQAKEFEGVINKLAAVELVYEEVSGKVIMTLLGKFTLIEETVNTDELKKQLKAEMEKLGFEIKRSSGMLSNAGFIAKAPEKLVAAEKQKLADNQAKYAELEAKYNNL